MKLVGLLLSVLAISLLFYFTYGKKDADEPGRQTAATGSLGVPPPPDMARNARGTAQYTKRQICLADCAAEATTCTATALEAEATEACNKTKAVCESACP